jgi:hypothetical protein
MARLQAVMRDLLLDLGRFAIDHLAPGPMAPAWLRTAS